MTEKITRMHITIPVGSKVVVHGADDGDDPSTEWETTFELSKPLVVWMEGEADAVLVGKVYTSQKSQVHKLDCDEYHQHEAPKCCATTCWCSNKGHEAESPVNRSNEQSTTTPKKYSRKRSNNR